jgi:hypothetical protein
MEQVATPSDCEAYGGPTRIWLQAKQRGQTEFHFIRNGLESSPEAVVTVTIASPFRPAGGTVAVIVVSFFSLKVAACPGPKETPRRQSAEPKFVPVIVTLSPAFPSSGASFAILGASPKQAFAAPAFSAV